MLRRLKHLALSTLERVGAFRVISITGWRRQRLLILCYHGVALEDEEQWCPGLYVTRQLFEARMEALAKRRCAVLPLSEGVSRLFNGTLPPRSVAITFDDGFYDFYALAYPVLRRYGYPTTVYQTTYYVEHRFPVFNLMLDYLFWRAGNRSFDAKPFGVDRKFDLAGPERARAVDALVRLSFRQNYTAAKKDEMATSVAETYGIDYEKIRLRRILQLMSAEQIAEVIDGGIDVQLHTHRHRTPLNEGLFVREIRDNREALRRYARPEATHFCYPSGVHRDDFLPWLRNQGIASATTCEIGLASRQSEPLLLPRLLDSTGVAQIEFEGWLTGLSAWLPRSSSTHHMPDPEPFWEESPSPQAPAF